MDTGSYLSAIALSVLAAAACNAQSLPAAPAGVNVTTSFGMEFVEISPGGQTLQLNPADPEYPTFHSQPNGVGAVSTPFRMARTELTSSSWATFVNTFSGREAPAWFNQYRFSLTVSGPLSWGARPATLSDGRAGWETVAGFESSPVNGITLAEAALYCNWLHNGQSTDFASLTSGAYQMAQFNPEFGLFSSPIQREAGARFWIPSMDEWVRAAHFNPASNAFRSWATGDSAPFYGPPGMGDANSGFEQVELPDGTLIGSQYLPVGSYPGVQSPWGLLDVAGSVREWTDTIILTPTGQFGQVAVEGSMAGLLFGGFDPADMGVYAVARFADSRGAGLRIAAMVPTPNALPAAFSLLFLFTHRRRRI